MIDKLRELWEKNDFLGLFRVLEDLNDNDLLALGLYELTVLGLAALNLGNLIAAEAPLKAAFELNPGDNAARLNFANCLKDQKRYKEAKKLYLGSAETRKDPDLVLGAAICSLELGENREAMLILKEGVARFPDNYRFRYHYGRVLFRFQKPIEACEEYKLALELNPQFAPAASNLSISAMRAGDLKLSVGMAEQLARSKYQDEGYFSGFMQVCLSKGFPQIGLKYFKESGLKYSPRSNLIAGECSRVAGDFEEAARYCEEVIQEDPSYGSAYVVAGHALQSLGKFEGAAERVSAIEEKRLLLSTDAARLPNPWTTFALTDCAESQLACAKTYSNAVTNRLPREKIHLHSKSTVQKVGLLSPDFGFHPVANCVMPLLEARFPDFEIHAFSSRPKADKMTEALRERAQFFYDIHDLDYAGVKRLSEKVGIDAMIDLAVHTTGGNAAYFSLGLAPIQINFLGYSGTSGSPGYDYILADRFVIPESLRHCYSEDVAYLEHSILSSLLADSSHLDAPARDKYSLPKEAVVFGCLAAHYKLSLGTVNAWAQILGRVPGSLLLLGPTKCGAEDEIRNYFRQHGISEDRIIFSKREDTRNQHIARLKVVDIFLDTFPYNAHSLAADALSAGVPVVTMSGRSFASRVAGGLLSSLNLEELITRSTSQYVEVAIKLAEDPSYRQSCASMITRSLRKNDWPKLHASDFKSKLLGLFGS